MNETIIHTPIDADIRDRAALVLEPMGLTVSDAVRLLLTRTAEDGVFPIDVEPVSESHDTWFRAMVLKAMTDARPEVADSDVEALFAKKRKAALVGAAL